MSGAVVQAPRHRHRARPWTLAALAATGIAGAAVYRFAREQPLLDPGPTVVDATPVAASGEFRLTEAEMRSLQVAVVERQFRSERLAEGVIAYDDEGVVPVFSPYGGGARVLRAVAKAGDAVRRGDTLFELESAALLRAEADLLSNLDRAGRARTALDHAGRELARQPGAATGGNGRRAAGPRLRSADHAFGHRAGPADGREAEIGPRDVERRG